MVQLYKNFVTLNIKEKENIMQTVQIDINDDKFNAFLTIVKSLKSDIVKNIRIRDDILDIESIEDFSEDYIDIQEAKKENNQKYSIGEAKDRKESYRS